MKFLCKAAVGARAVVRALTQPRRYGAFYLRGFAFHLREFRAEFSSLHRGLCSVPYALVTAAHILFEDFRWTGDQLPLWMQAGRHDFAMGAVLGMAFGAAVGALLL